jgi:hypothetical protein
MLANQRARSLLREGGEESVSRHTITERHIYDIEGRPIAIDVRDRAECKRQCELRNAPSRHCSTCRIRDGLLIPAAYVVLAPDGFDRFVCLECAKNDWQLGPKFKRDVVVGIYEWYRMQTETRAHGR